MDEKRGKTLIDSTKKEDEKIKKYISQTHDTSKHLI